jgi:hypothetical protein
MKTVETGALSIVESRDMSLFVPLYGSFRACLKQAVLVPAHGPRSRPKPGPTLKYFVSCRVWTVLFFFILRTDPSDPAQMYTYTAAEYE